MSEFPMPSTQEWGPKYWYIMYMGIKILEREEFDRGTVSRSMSENVKNFYESLVHMFPCHECKSHYAQLVVDTPPRTASSAELKEWLQYVGQEVKRNQERMEKAKEAKEAKDAKDAKEDSELLTKDDVKKRNVSTEKSVESTEKVTIPVAETVAPEKIRIPISISTGSENISPEPKNTNHTNQETFSFSEGEDLHSTIAKPAIKKGAVTFTKGQTKSNSNTNKYIIKNLGSTLGIRRHSVLVNGIVQALVTSSSRK